MFNLYEAAVAYQSVLDEDFKNEILSEEDNDLYSGIEDLNEVDISLLAEEVVEDLLTVGFDSDDIEFAFIDSLDESLDYNKQVINEAKVTSSLDRPQSETSKSKVTTGTGTLRVAKARLKATKARRRSENIQRLKNKLSDTVKSVKDRAARTAHAISTGVKSGINKAKEAGREAKFQAVDKHVASYANRRGLHPAPGLAARSKNPEKRRELRGRVVSDIKDRIVSKARDIGSRFKSGVKDTVGKLKDVSKKGAKKVVGKVATGAAIGSAHASRALGRASYAAANLTDKSYKLAKRMGEDFDVFDIVSDYLISEGYAENEDHAAYIMANEMTDEILEAILDEAKVDKRMRGVSAPDRKADERNARNGYYHVSDMMGWPPLGDETSKRREDHEKRRGVKTRG